MARTRWSKRRGRRMARCACREHVQLVQAMVGAAPDAHAGQRADEDNQPAVATI